MRGRLCAALVALACVGGPLSVAPLGAVAADPTVNWTSTGFRTAVGGDVEHVTELLLRDGGATLWAAYYDSANRAYLASSSNGGATWATTALTGFTQVRVLLELSDGSVLVGGSAAGSQPPLRRLLAGSSPATGLTWASCATGAGSAALPSPTAETVWDVVINTAGVMYVGVGSSRNNPALSNPTVLASTDHCATLTAVAPLPGLGVTSMAIDSRDRLYVAMGESDEHDDVSAAGQARVFYSDNGGAAWTESATITGANRVYRLFVKRNGTVLAGSGISGEFYRSTDRGATFTKTTHVPAGIRNFGSPPVPTSFPATRVYSILELTNGWVIVGSGNSTGDLFLTPDDGNTWFATGDTGPSIVCWAIVQRSDGTIVIGTGSRGGDIWTGTVSGVTTTAAFGQVDTPLQAVTGVQGAFGITGWALDDVGVQHVRIYRQCFSFDVSAACQTVLGTRVVYLGQASIIAGARPDVEALYPSWPFANAAGWGFLILSNLLPNVPASNASGGGVGTFILYAVATDQEGNQKLLGRTVNDTTPTTVTVANDTIAKPFGAIDTPGQGATVSGTISNFGWALTPDANTFADGTDILVPTTGATVNVIIDGASVGTATFNLCRGPIAVGGVTPAGQLCDDDVSGIFRAAGLYRNLDAGRGPIGLRSINTTTLSNGLHTIQWGVTDSASRGEGIGSRYFNVLNSASDAPVGRAAGPVFGAAGLQPGSAVGLKPNRSEEVFARTGFDLHAAFTPLESNADGVPQVRIPELGRVELQVPGATHVSLLANGEVRSAPVGMSVDEEAGMVRWSVGPGYLGTYRLQIEVPESRGPEVHGAASPRFYLLDVTVAPMTLVEESVRMHLDRAVAHCPIGSLAHCLITIEGWALDPQAETGSGIGAVHVWAKRRSPEVPESRGDETPLFLGTADLGVSRPDVAAAHGARFTNAGFSFQGALGDGEWEITAFIWNARTGRFEDARTVTITVK